MARCISNPFYSKASALESLSLSDHEAAWTNFSFIICGVLTGLTVGYFNRGPQHFSMILKAMFVVTSLALVALNILTLAQGRMHKATLYPLLVVFMGLCGASSLGFIGVALSAVVESTYPVAGEYSGFLVEWWLQIFAAVLTQVATLAGAYAFVVCGIATWLTTALMLLLYRQELRKTDPPPAADAEWAPLIN